MEKTSPPTVAVIGLGAFGLTTVKNLAEEGFKVTGFERNPYVGGLWHYTTRAQTSVLKGTVANVSKTRGCFTDFPYPKTATEFPLASEVQQYLEDYVDHFGLRPMLRLDCPIRHVEREPRTQRWLVTLERTGDVLHFDKVVVATGVNNKPLIPGVKGRHRFKGEVLHSRDYKGPQRFQDKKVVVVGLGNSGGDVSSSLVGYAEQVHVSHRVGAYIIPRYVKGKPFDHEMTMRIERIRSRCTKIWPSMATRVFDRYVKGLQDQCFDMRPEWNLADAPSLEVSAPVIADTVVSHLESGAILSVSGIREFLGDKEVLLDSGQVLSVDVVIWCTGYQMDFSFLGPELDPTRPTDQQGGVEACRGRALPRLYRNIFSLEYPESLAFVGYISFPSPSFQAHDLAAMALAQVWKGKSRLPSPRAMRRAVDKHHAWLCKLARKGRTHPAWVSWPGWLDWVNEAAGTGVREHLGWGLRGWKFWATEGGLHGLVMDGVYTPHTFRLFETGKRKVWDGALDEIIRVNNERRGKEVL